MSSDDPRFTAYALGEAQEAAVVAEIESALAADPALRAGLEEMRGFSLDLRAAVRQSEVVVARPFVRVLPFRPEAEHAPWRRQLLRMAAAFAVSAAAIGVTGWWTSNHETKAQVPERELAAVEIELGPAEAGHPGSLTPQERAQTERTDVGARWSKLTAALQEGRLPEAGAVPGRQELLGLLPALPVSSDGRISVATAAVPRDGNAAWLAVTIPAHLTVGRTISVETRRVDHVTVREVCSGFGPAGERVVLFVLSTPVRRPVVEVHLAGTEPRQLAAADLWQDFRTAPAGLRQAVALAAFGDALRGTPAEAKVAMREALRIAEEAGDAGLAVLALGRRAVELLEAREI